MIETYDLEEMEKILALQELKSLLSKIQQIVNEKEPRLWFKPMAKEILKLTRSKTVNSPLVRTFIDRFGQELVDILRYQTRNPGIDQAKIIDSVLAIKKVAETIQQDELRETSNFKLIATADLVKNKNIRLTTKQDKRFL